MILIFPRDRGRSKGVPSGTGDFLRLLVGELGTPKLAQIFAYGKWLYPYNATTRVVRSGPKMSENSQFWGRMHFPHQIYSHLPPKSPPKPHFGGPFNPKPIIQRAPRQSHVNGATTLKLYGYIRLYLGCIEIFPLGDVWGRRATNVNLGTPDISEATTARKLNLKYHQIW